MHRRSLDRGWNGHVERTEVGSGKCFNQQDSLKVKHRVLFVLKLIAIEYSEDGKPKGWFRKVINRRSNLVVQDIINLSD